MATLARRVLSCPASNIFSERLFLGGRGRLGENPLPLAAQEWGEDTLPASQFAGWELFTSIEKNT